MSLTDYKQRHHCSADDTFKLAVDKKLTSLLEIIMHMVVNKRLTSLFKIMHVMAPRSDIDRLAGPVGVCHRQFFKKSIANHCLCIKTIFKLHQNNNFCPSYKILSTMLCS